MSCCVRYGDRVPKSVAGRLFGVVWIYFGLVIMAIFMANITTALTAASMDRTELNGKTVKYFLKYEIVIIIINIFIDKICQT